MGMRVKSQTGAPIACAECGKERGATITVNDGQDKVTVECTICGAKDEFGVFRNRKTVIES